MATVPPVAARSGEASMATVPPVPPPPVPPALGTVSFGRFASTGGVLVLELLLQPAVSTATAAPVNRSVLQTLIPLRACRIMFSSLWLGPCWGLGSGIDTVAGDRSR